MQILDTFDYIYVEYIRRYFCNKILITNNMRNITYISTASTIQFNIFSAMMSRRLYSHMLGLLACVCNSDQFVLGFLTCVC